MASVFIAQPPTFSKKEITQYLIGQFGSVESVNELYSDRDQNFLIQLTLGDSYILKISNPAEQESILDLQKEATNFIQVKDPTLGVPRQIGDIKTIEKNGKMYFVRQVQFLEGNFLKDQRLDKNSYQQLGAFLGRLSKVLDGFYHPSADRPFEWDVRSVNLIEPRLEFLNSDYEREIICFFLNEYNYHVSPIVSDLRMAIIHNDGNDHNVLVNEKGVTTGIIDFGDMVYSYQVAEIAVCMAYVGLEKNDPKSAMIHVLKGYQSIFPLNESELSSLIYLICIRLCISVTMSAWRMSLFPDNEYLSVSQQPAWELLNKIKNENMNDWSIQFVNIAKNGVT